MRPNIAALTGDLAAARLRWKTANIQDYSYEIDQFAAPVGFPKVRVTVKNGTPISAELVNPQPGEVLIMVGSTIDQRFDEIASSISYASTTTCQEVSATYDATDGHPLRIDSGTALKGAEDGFGSLVFSNFTRL
jgi:Family of unknown function (DUF6174)